MRAFLAIELPARIQDILYRTSLDLRERISPRTAVRWARPANIHLTLRFLGDVQPELIPRIGRALDKKVAPLPLFDLALNELGCFPNQKNPRVIWVGVGGNTVLLTQLHRTIEQELLRFGWEPEGRRFLPHLTIGRVKDHKQVANAGLPYGQIIGSPLFSVKTVSLIESILKPEGASYTTRYESSLELIK